MSLKKLYRKLDPRYVDRKVRYIRNLNTRTRKGFLWLPKTAYGTSHDKNNKNNTYGIYEPVVLIPKTYWLVYAEWQEYEYFGFYGVNDKSIATRIATSSDFSQITPKTIPKFWNPYKWTKIKTLTWRKLWEWK